MKLLITLLLILKMGVYMSQNLVPNGSFEELDALHPNSPTTDAQISHAKNWKNFNTADLISDEDDKFHQTAAGQKQLAHTGHNFAGFGPCEGAQIKLEEQVPEMSWVTISFWFSPKSSEDSEINVYLMTDQAGDNSLDNCYAPSMDYVKKFTMNIEASIANSAPKHIPGKWYQYKSEPFLVGHETIKWLAFKGINDGGALGDPRYLFIDDIELTVRPFCYNMCKNSDSVHFVVQPAPHMIGNTAGNFFTTIKGASQVEFFVWNTWGELAFYTHSYDANTLVDEPIGGQIFDDFAIVWNGHSNLTGGDFNVGTVYNYRIIARSCADASPLYHDGSIFLVGIYLPPAVHYEPTHISYLEECCDDNRIYQNKTFLENDRTDVIDYILAGENVTGGTIGEVIVSTNTEVSFYAGNYIQIEPGFIVEQGGVFIGEIEPCGHSYSYRSGATDSSTNDIDLRRNFTNYPDSLIAKNQLMVYPNPTKSGLVNVDGLVYNSVVTILDLFGRIIYSENVYDTKIILDISSETDGIYILNIRDNEKNETLRIIKN